MPSPASNSVLWPLDLETGVRVASKVGTFIPNLGTLGLWVLELFAMYATDGRTDEQMDWQTDGQKQRLLPPSWSGHNNDELKRHRTNPDITASNLRLFIKEKDKDKDRTFKDKDKE